jgi:hypothetical protein
LRKLTRRNDNSSSNTKRHKHETSTLAATLA